MSLTAPAAASWALLQARLGYTFGNVQLLVCALTHRSYTHEVSGQHADYERLEFVGDAVIGLIVGTYLYRTHPQHSEGQLSQMRAGLVSREGLAALARQLDLGTYLLLGHGEEQNGGRTKDSLLAAAFEAVVAAIYLDSDFTTAQDVFLRCFAQTVRQRTADAPQKDYKGLLQQQTLRLFGVTPTYRLVREEGPPHCRTFYVQLALQRGERCLGVGSSKKAAEQHAAQQVLAKMQSGDTQATPE